MSDETLDLLFVAIWNLIDVGWKSDESIFVKRFNSAPHRWQVKLGTMVHNGDDLGDAAAGLYKELRQKAEDRFNEHQLGADKWRTACDYPVPAWAWPKGDDQPQVP